MFKKKTFYRVSQPLTLIQTRFLNPNRRWDNCVRVAEQMFLGNTRKQSDCIKALMKQIRLVLFPDPSAAALPGSLCGDVRALGDGNDLCVTSATFSGWMGHRRQLPRIHYTAQTGLCHSLNRGSETDSSVERQVHIQTEQELNITRSRFDTRGEMAKRLWNYCNSQLQDCIEYWQHNLW